MQFWLCVNKDVSPSMLSAVSIESELTYITPHLLWGTGARGEASTFTGQHGSEGSRHPHSHHHYGFPVTTNSSRQKKRSLRNLAVVWTDYCNGKWGNIIHSVFSWKFIFRAQLLGNILFILYVLVSKRRKLSPSLLCI